MHPAGPPPPQNRSCPSPSIAPCPSPSPSLLQQQQHVIYGPITALQPCPTNIHPHCVYTGVQRNPGLSGTSGPLSNQVSIRHAKLTKWQQKSKPNRGHQHHHPNHHHHHHHQQSHQQQYCQSLQQTHLQQPLSYIPKPLVLFDQCQTNQTPPGVPPSATSFLVASSNFPHSPYGPGDHYTSAAGLTLIPQPYFKPPEVTQAFCLLPERPQATQHHQQSLAGQTHGPYYNISTGSACNVQAINNKPTFHVTNVTNPYGNVTTFGGNQIPSGQAAPTGAIFQNSPFTFGTASGDKLPMQSSVDVQANCSRNLTMSSDAKHQGTIIPRTENIEWPVRTVQETSNIFEFSDAVTSPRVSSSPNQTNRYRSSTTTKNQDERYSDESAASFDFTIEAEKMVSALCNTASSNDIGKDETRGRNEISPSYGGAAGDNVTNKTNMWFADFCTEYGVAIGQNNRTTSTQTQVDRHDSQSYPEIMRKTIYWGCNEAESILNSSCYRGYSRAMWLANISNATRTAVTKSSTCFPIYSGDKTLVQDLINALLRIGNGWLVLDNYFNKQHYPSLDEKFDGELTSRFKTWEVVTQDLLRELVKTLASVEENISNSTTRLESMVHQENPTNTSFPGDVNLYTSNDLFDSSQRHRDNVPKQNNSDRPDRDSTYTLQYPSQSTSHSNFQSFEPRQQSQKETKLRSKWTITENLSSTPIAIDSGKTVPDLSLVQSDVGFSVNNRLRVKNSSNSSTPKITSSSSSSRRSLNAEFFHLRNKVMERMGNSNELERQRWGLKEQQYDFVFGTSRGTNTSGTVSGSCEPIFKIRTAGGSYENAYARRCLPIIDTTSAVSQTSTSHCTNVDGSVYLVAGAETTLDSTFIGGVGSIDRNKTYPATDYTGSVRIAELKEKNCGNDLVVSATGITSVKTDPIYVGKAVSDRRELATVPGTKMTLLSQIEGNPSNANRDTKEMTANLSAWFASMRNSNCHRAINCPVEGRKCENTTVTRQSTHPQETSRSAMDLNRQLHIDGNRQLQTLQNMQALQSQPWNASNLLNNKRTSVNVQRNVDEYDSSEDVRVYMKPGSYNVPKKRHQRKSSRRAENSGNSRVNNNNNTPRTRGIREGNYNSSAKNQASTSVSSLLIASSVQVSTTTTTTSTSMRAPFPAIPIVPATANFSLQSSPRILRRARTISNQETRRDVAWKAACASAEILLEALSVKATVDGQSVDSKSPNSLKNSRIDFTPINQDGRSMDRSSHNESAKDDEIFYEASSYEASEDDSSSTFKLSPDRCSEAKSRDTKQPKTNVKTDSWLIRTLNNASVVNAINPRESDAESTIGESLNNSFREDDREHKLVVTSTPEPVKMTLNENFVCSTIVGRKLADSFPEKSITDSSPRDSENLERSGSSNRQTPLRNLSISLIDTSGEFAGRATYSETVRRSTGKSYIAGKLDSCKSRQTRSMSSFEPTIKSSIITVPGKKYQRRESDKCRQSIHKSRRMMGKRISRDAEEKRSEEGRASKRIVEEDAASGENFTKSSSVKSQTRKKDDGGSFGGWTPDAKSKVSERGWSVWYSSRRKQTLSSMALNKLATIHQTILQMDDAKLLKYPTTSLGGSGATNDTIDDECKVIKSPIFLETIGYKLKNRIYHKIEHAVRDYRRIVNNSKSYHKNDTDRIAKIEMLSKRFEELFDEHFANWDCDDVSESPSNNNGTSRCKSPQRQQQKSASSRTNTVAKKNSSATTKNEN